MTSSGSSVIQVNTDSLLCQMYAKDSIVYSTYHICVDQNYRTYSTQNGITCLSQLIREHCQQGEGRHIRYGLPPVKPL